MLQYFSHYDRVMKTIHLKKFRNNVIEYLNGFSAASFPIVTYLLAESSSTTSQQRVINLV